MNLHQYGCHINNISLLDLLLLWWYFLLLRGYMLQYVPFIYWMGIRGDVWRDISTYFLLYEIFWPFALDLRRSMISFWEFCLDVLLGVSKIVLSSFLTCCQSLHKLWMSCSAPRTTCGLLSFPALLDVLLRLYSDRNWEPNALKASIRFVEYILVIFLLILYPSVSLYIVR